MINCNKSKMNSYNYLVTKSFTEYFNNQKFTEEKYFIFRIEDEEFRRYFI